jgi:hypothetical protein
MSENETDFATRCNARPSVPFYEDYWRPFDRDHTYWRDTIGKGHAARARVDTFLQNWLTKETVEPVSAKHIYDRFLKLSEVRSSIQADGVGVAESLMTSIRTDATRFERIDRPTGNTRFDVFLDRLKSLDVVVFHPVLFELMDGLSQDAEALGWTAGTKPAANISTTGLGVRTVTVPVSGSCLG